MILVLDNRDSYTYNLVQALRERTVREVRVVGADDGDEALRLYAAGGVVGVVISPGPGHPDAPSDFAASGTLIDAVLAAEARGEPLVPLLGVCLGHQGLARRFGYEVVRAPEPRHGWLSPLTHTGDGLFAGLPEGTRVTRYHSLAIVPGPAPSPRLRVTARSEDGVAQAFDIDGAPWFGVQFHPESIASEHGGELLGRFLDVVEREAAGRPAAPTRRRMEASAAQAPSRTLHVATRDVPLAPLGLDACAACEAVARGVLARGRGSFWLDSALADGDDARWSLLGDAIDVVGDGAPAVLRFRDGTLTSDVLGASSGAAGAPGTFGETDAVDAGEAIVRRREPCADPFAFLADELAGVRVDGGEGLPFRGGLVGFLGYELGLREGGVDPARIPRAVTPDACWVRPGRVVAVDHRSGRLTVCVVSADAAAAEATVEREAAGVRAALAGGVPQLAGSTRPRDPAHPGGPAQAGGLMRPGVPAHPGGDDTAPGRWRDDRAAYAEKIAACQAALRAGDSYELCLTTTFEVDEGLDIDPLELFVDLAAHHPAPYAALLELDDDGEPLAIVSASPERYLRGRGDRYETKPIKGTAPRHPEAERDRALAAELATDPKTFAENLMIVDLLRNDLGRVCRPGSVEVPALMRVESYASLHQLVSTVVGVAEPGIGPVDVARALFPGGSMTGAPKRRSVEILAELEGHARGVYSGALGFFSADGLTELSIVIRTAVLAAGRWTIGAGGAIVLASDADDESDEVELKSLALRRAIARVGRAP